MAPSNTEFRKIFDEKMLIELDLKSSKEEVKQKIKYLWEQRKHIYSSMNSLSDDYFSNHTWEKRVQEIIGILRL
jgi:shikimate kinase